MTQRSFGQRLWDAFFPPTPPKTVTRLTAWKGTDIEFFAELERKGFDALTATNEKRPIPTLYTHPQTGDLIGLSIRWPNGIFYYTATQVRR